MKTIRFALFLLLLGNASNSSLNAAQSSDTSPTAWQAGTFRGLTVGKSTQTDMVRILGKPLSSVRSADQDPARYFISNDYGPITGELPGRLSVEVNGRNNRIESIFISTDRFSRHDAIAYLGSDYREVFFEFCKDLPDGPDGLAYQTVRSGPISYIEYPSKGVATHVGNNERIYGIYFLSAPIGLASEKDCQKEIQKQRRKAKSR